MSEKKKQTKSKKSKDNKDKTSKIPIVDLVFIVDKSGSMMGKEEDTIGGINSILHAHKEKNKGKEYVTLVLFDNNYEVLYDRKILTQTEDITDSEYQIGGTTALLDAMGKTITNLDKAQKNKDTKADKVVVVIITDGHENSSKEYNLDQLKKSIEKHTADGWEFIYLGADLESMDEAGDIGIGYARSASYVDDPQGRKIMYAAVATATADFLCCESESLSDDWKDEIDKDFKKRGKK